jgi:hypothetical protein
MVLAVGTDGVAGRHVPADDIGVGRRHLPGPRQSCDWSRLRLRSLPALRALCRISFRGSGIWRVNRVEVSHGFTVRSARAHGVINRHAPVNSIANARLAEKIVERIAHHATVDPAGWEAFAAAEIKLALDAATRRLQ